ncbi:MAG: DNA polymerase III subunit delta [Candidatus Uhrbacteria bacterium]|nr:DNA polymerase III subunit delta [Candidatus Uhrbacteria bacterium]
MSDHTKKIVPRIYAFIGHDDFSVAQKVKTWIQAFQEKHGAHGISVFDCQGNGDLSSALKSTLQGSGLFQTQTLVVIKNPWGAKSSDIQSLLSERLESLPSTHFLVITDTSMDGRTGLAKTLTQLQKKDAASIEMYDVPAGNTLRSWIRARASHYGGTFEKNAEGFFANAYSQARDSVPESEESPFDLWCLDNEIQKLVSYANGQPVTTDTIVRIASLPSSAHIFHLTDMLLEKKYRNALHSALELVGDDPSRARAQLMALISYLLSQFHSFVLLKSMEEDGVTESEAAQHLGWNAKRVWVVTKKIRALSSASLQTSLGGMLDFERMLKTGAGDPLLHLNLLIRAITR